MSDSPFYPFSNLAAKFPQSSQQLSTDEWGNPVLGTSSFVLGLFHFEENDDKRTRIPEGLRKSFNYGVDSFYIQGYVTDIEGESFLPEYVKFEVDYAAIYKPQFLGSELIVKGVLRIHKTLPTAFSETSITGQNLNATLFIPESQKFTESEYAALEDHLTQIYL